MLTITMNVNYQRKLSEYNKVVAEEQIAKNTLDSITEKVDDIAASVDSKSQLSKNESYQQLVAFQSAYDVKVANLESQAKELKSQCDNMKNALSNNQSHNIWCFG